MKGLQSYKISTESLLTNAEKCLLAEADLYYNQKHFRIGKYDIENIKRNQLLKESLQNKNCEIGIFFNKIMEGDYEYVTGDDYVPKPQSAKEVNIYNYYTTTYNQPWQETEW